MCQFLHFEGLAWLDEIRTAIRYLLRMITVMRMNSFCIDDYDGDDKGYI